MNKLSIVIPCKDDGSKLELLLEKIIEQKINAEILVVNDGSKDNTSGICAKYNVKEVTHPYNKGNGASIKSGANSASGDILVFMDADNQHDPKYIKQMLEKLESGYDMIIAARDYASHENFFRLVANKFYNSFSSYVVGNKVKDLTSGFRVVDAAKFREFINILPNGFSYPTTITMAFYRAGYSVGFMPVKFNKRNSASHIKPLSDGIRFLLIIFKVGTLYSPLKVFFPVGIFHVITGFFYYLYTFVLYERFTNMSALLISNGLIIFLIGLVAEQITALMYMKKNR
ncbi:glycosyltransferase family 2 protein [Spartinivicinus poritis]|uniref:Glycosyltransferase family 2 protein n=1 Tax=Spartinivicinus poritis TaxID=2994640 RepID=A0ABT5UBJ7_9GAMM|nr:glycosyltransferase family 2 protein [Spartinivicinus sp. A2-2]MDE1462808.1 glycosyltransferase family 2 protein [Spartinivicinus sp. A2-2]